MRPHSHEARKLRATLAHQAVLGQAHAGRMPEDPELRAAEGQRRARAAQRVVEAQVRKQVPCRCSPGDLTAWGRAIIEVIQAVYTLLKTLGIIKPDGGTQ